MIKLSIFNIQSLPHKRFRLHPALSIFDVKLVKPSVSKRQRSSGKLNWRCVGRRGSGHYGCLRVGHARGRVAFDDKMVDVDELCENSLNSQLQAMRLESGLRG